MPQAHRFSPSRVALAVALSLLLAGCAGTPQRAATHEQALPELPLPASATLQPGLAIDRWWTLFDDAELAALIEQALQRNHDLAIAAARVREARARLDEARAARLPALELQLDLARARQSADALPSGAPLTGSDYGARLAARHELDLWGRIAAAGDAAEQQLAAQQWARASVAWGLTAQIAEAHFSLRALQRQIDISRAVLASREQTLALRRREHAAGSAAEFELRRAEAESADAQITLTGLQRQQAALQATLALLVGRPPAELAGAEAAATPLDPALPFAARLPAGSAAEMLLRRPDLRRAEALLQASHADVAAARAATLPLLRLSGSVGSDVRMLSSLFDGPGFVWALALSASQSLFDGGQLRARVEQAEARSDAALTGYRQSVLAAVAELREAYAALDLTQQAQLAQTRRVAALERARVLALTGRRAGALSQLDLLDAERNAFSAQLAEVSAYRDRLIGQVAAYKALGGGVADPLL